MRRLTATIVAVLLLLNDPVFAEFDFSRVNEAGFPLNRELTDKHGLEIYGDTESVPGFGDEAFLGMDHAGRPIPAPDSESAGTYLLFRFWEDDPRFPDPDAVRHIMYFDDALSRRLREIHALPEVTRPSLRFTHSDPSPHNYLYIDAYPRIDAQGHGYFAEHDPSDGRTVYRSAVVPPLAELLLPRIETECELLSTRDEIRPDGAVRRFEAAVRLVFRETPFPTLYFGPEDAESAESRFRTPAGEEVVVSDFVRTGPNALTGTAEFTLPLEQIDRFRGRLDREPEPVLSYFGLEIASRVRFPGGEALSEGAHHGLNNPVVTVRKRPTAVRFEHPRAILDTERFALIDGTDAEKQVYVDGVRLSPPDEARFLSGRYCFPLTGSDRIYSFTILCRSGEAVVQEYSDYVLVCSTKPRLQLESGGCFKQDRAAWIRGSLRISDFARSRIGAEIRRIDLIPGTSGDSADGSEFTGYDAVFTGGGADFAGRPDPSDASAPAVLYRKNEGGSAEFLARKPGILRAVARTSVTIPSERIHREDIPPEYHAAAALPYTLYIAPDLPPAVLLAADREILTRTESLELLHEAVSIDRDLIGSVHWTLRRGGETICSGHTPPPLNALELGDYTVECSVREVFGQPTYPELLGEENSGADCTARFDFTVANGAPVTRLFWTAPPPNDPIDVEIVTRTPEDADHIAGSRTEIANRLRRLGADVAVGHRDLFAYTATTEASFHRDTGESYPPASMHFSEEGYSGTLPCIAVTNRPYFDEEVLWESRSVSETVSLDLDNRSGSAVYQYIGGSWVLIEPWRAELLPETIVRTHRGQSVTLHKTGVTDRCDPEPSLPAAEGALYRRAFHWIAHYSGVYTGTENVRRTQYVEKNSFTGQYAGTLSKIYTVPYREQPREGASLLRFYYNCEPDDAERAERPGTVLRAPDREAAVDAIVSRILDEMPVFPRRTALVGTELPILTAEIDPESDPIRTVSCRYEHDPAVYDDPSPAANPAANPEVNPEANPEAAPPDGSDRLIRRFPGAGLYRIRRQVEDLPPGAPQASERSNIAELEFRLHRRPVASFRIETRYDSLRGDYLTTVCDESYDPDYRYRRADRGIRERRWRIEAAGDSSSSPGTPPPEASSHGAPPNGTPSAGSVLTSLPQRLPPGSYRFTLAVRDIYGVWSVPESAELHLASDPSAELSSRLAVPPPYGPEDVPASAQIRLTGIETRCPGEHRIEIELRDSSGARRFQKTLPFIQSTPDDGRPDGRRWDDVPIDLPGDSADGRCTLSVRAVPDIPGVREAKNEHRFRVITPITIEGSAETDGDLLILTARTNEAVSEVRAAAFYGTPHSVQAALVPTEPGHWRAEIDLSGLPPVPPGTFEHRFIAAAPSGAAAEDRITAQFEHFIVDGFRIRGYWDLWRGSRFMSYEKIVVEAEIRGEPSEVSLRFSPELEAMEYTNKLGQRYRYRDETGFEVEFPLPLRRVGAALWKAEYILPLAASTIPIDSDSRVHPPYCAEITVRGAFSEQKRRIVFDVSGNIYDHLLIQPGSD